MNIHAQAHTTQPYFIIQGLLIHVDKMEINAKEQCYTNDVCFIPILIGCLFRIGSLILYLCHGCAVENIMMYWSALHPKFIFIFLYNWFRNMI